MGFRDRVSTLSAAPFISSFQYSLRIVGFRDSKPTTRYRKASKLSVFPANRGVPRRSSDFNCSLSITTFSIPCESWGSATFWNDWKSYLFLAFQYSLRIVGFRDLLYRIAAYTLYVIFQYSLRIVGFRDHSSRHPRTSPYRLSVFPANRGVPRQETSLCFSRIWVILSVFPANRGVPRRILARSWGIRCKTFSIPCESWGSATQLNQVREKTNLTYLSVFPANRGVPRPVSSHSFSSSYVLSVFPANRGVPRQQRWMNRSLIEYGLSVFPANRGVPRPQT